MARDPSLMQSVRALQLPAPYGTDGLVYDAILASLQHLEGGRPGDIAIRLTDDVEKWEAGEKPSPVVKTAVTAGLSAVSGDHAVGGKEYFAIYDRLGKGGKRDWRGLEHATAVRLLSRTRLISYLIKVERFSCSQVTRYLSTVEDSLSVPYKAVQVIANSLDARPELDRLTAVDDLWEADSSRSARLFADSSTVESCDIAAEEIRRWIPETRAGEHLLIMLNGAIGGSDPSWQYLQILHWCTTPLEFYDHPASHLYEFAPRSETARSLFAHYPAATGNPVLNNAKAVSKFDRAWANNRSALDGHALVTILESLEALPFNARRDVARVLRAWLVRIIELHDPVIREIPPHVPLDRYEHLADQVSLFETNTAGVVEQRVVDALGVLAYAQEGWVPKGLGDSVNASNLSRKKLGDIEFTNVDERRAVAVEAHGGFLSHAYVAAHQKSLRRIIELRLEQSWSALDKPEHWSVQVVFVAHSAADDLPVSEIIHGVQVVYEYLTYFDLIALAVEESNPAYRNEVYDLYVRAELNRGSVRQSVRDVVAEIMNVELAST